ncbi:MAG: hypothetical protein KBA46_00670 [Candidatus Omnitrophica bacterium]|nr:hypothetical protein [Candidatus Omnitrophota bacterium]
MSLDLKIKNLEVSPDQAKVIGIAVCAGVSILVLVLIGFNIISYSQIENRFRGKRIQLEALENDAKNLNKLVEKYTTEREKLEAMLFSEQDIAMFLDKVSELSKKYKIKIEDLKAQSFVEVPLEDAAAKTNPPPRKDSGTEEEKLAFMPIKMTVISDFFNLTKFLIDLEQPNQLMTLTDINVNRTKYPLLKCTFTLKLYGLKKGKTG